MPYGIGGSQQRRPDVATLPFYAGYPRESNEVPLNWCFPPANGCYRRLTAPLAALFCPEPRSVKRAGIIGATDTALMRAGFRPNLKYSLRDVPKTLDSGAIVHSTTTFIHFQIPSRKRPRCHVTVREHASEWPLPVCTVFTSLRIQWLRNALPRNYRSASSRRTPWC